MNKILSSRRLFLIGLLLVVVTNIVVFAGVILNRANPPESQTVLTQRELQLPFSTSRENSGLALSLIWRTLVDQEEYTRYGSWGRGSWLNTSKLRDLGFSVDKYVRSMSSDKAVRKQESKEVFLVLENNGDAYKKAVNRAVDAKEVAKKLLALSSDDSSLIRAFEQADERLAREQNEESRLFSIDAGLDPDALRAQYPDRSRFIIAVGVIEARYNSSKNDEEVIGYISKLSVEKIHVPFEYRDIFEARMSRVYSSTNGKTVTSEIKVDLAYGHRYEPWIVSVK